MNRFRRIVTVGHNARVIVWNRRPTEREETVKQRSQGDIQRDALHRRQARSYPPQGCLWRLWRSASTLTESFRPNGIFFCWWRISWYFECPETDLQTVENAGCINESNTWSPKRVHVLAIWECLHCSTSDYGCEEMLELYTGVAQAGLTFTGIHMEVASKPKIPWIPATIHNSGWMDDCQVCHGSIEAISILDHVDVDQAYSHIASFHHSVQCHVRSHEWRDGSFGKDGDSMQGRLVLCSDVSLTEAFLILHRSHTNDGYSSDFRTQPRSFQEVAIL